MENLNQVSELVNELNCLAENMYSEESRGVEMLRWCLWSGEELSMSSLRANLEEVGLRPWEREIKAINRSQWGSVVLDDGWLHVSVQRSMLSPGQLKEIESEHGYKHEQL